MNTITNVSRRKFLAGSAVATGALVLGVHYYPKLSSGDKLPHDTNADRCATRRAVQPRFHVRSVHVPHCDPRIAKRRTAEKRGEPIKQSA